MKVSDHFLQELQILDSSFRTGQLALSMLAIRLESLIEQLRADLTSSLFSEAMDCVYVIEEINAISLDERRNLESDEVEIVKSKLKRLEKLLTQD